MSFIQTLRVLISAAMIVCVSFGCEKETASTPMPAVVEQSHSENATTAPAPSTTRLAASAPVLPEDQIIDAALEAPIRARAAEQKAVRPGDLPKYAVGQSVLVLVRGRINDGGIYGSGPYTLDSSIRRAAIHAGLLKDGELALLAATIVKHPGDHTSEERNGVRPNKWGKYHASYLIEKVNMSTTTLTESGG